MACLVCGDSSTRVIFGRTSWEEVLDAAKSCAACDALVRGSCGWLDTRGWSHIIPNEISVTESRGVKRKEITLYLSNFNAPMDAKKAQPLGTSAHQFLHPTDYTTALQEIRSTGRSDAQNGIISLKMHTRLYRDPQELR
jgi:hypothetical protein